MIDPKFIDDITTKISKLIPDSIKDIQKDLEKNVKAILQSTFTKMDLVTRKEFDVQTKVLARTREKLEKIEARLESLEKPAKRKSKE